MSKFATALFLGMVTSSALAQAGTPPAQTHHCKMPDGSMDMKKTHKQCTAAKGTWAQDAAAPKADAPKADAPKTDAPKADAPKAVAPKADVPKAAAPKTP